MHRGRPDRLRARAPRRDARKVVAIREQRDLENEDQRAIREINPGIYVAEESWLREHPRRARAEERPGRALPDRHRRAHARGEAAHRHRPSTRASRCSSASTTASSSSRPRSACIGAFARSTSARGVTVRGGALIDDSVRDRNRRPRRHERRPARRDAHRLRAFTSVSARSSWMWWSAQGAVIKPYSVVEKSRVGAPRADRALRAPAARQRHRGGGSRRQLRRDQEDADGQGRQGQSPRLPRRRRDRRGREHRRRARSSATTTACRSTRRPSARARSSAATPSSSPP